MIRKIFRKLPYKILMIIGIKHDKELLTQTRIAEYINSHVSSVNYWITKLEAIGLLSFTKNNRRGYVSLSKKGTNLFKYLWQNDILNKSKFRGHNIEVSSDIIIRNLDKLKEHSVYVPLAKGYKLEISDSKIMVYEKKLICTVPDIYADKLENIVSAIMDYSVSLLKIMEQEYGIITTSKPEILRIERIHVAILNSVLAKSYMLKKGSYISNKIVIDKSKGIYELETIDPDTALSDMEVVVKYEDLARENKKLREELRKTNNRDKSITKNEIEGNNIPYDREFRNTKNEVEGLDIW